MIINFSVSNFKSFRDRMEFNMQAGLYKRLPEHVYTGTKHANLLRSSAIYGNNGAGKSNLLIAIETLRFIVLGKIEDYEKDIPYFKLDEVYRDQPTVFQIDYLINENRYSYSVSILKGKIIEEWLYKVIDNTSNKVETIFERVLRNGKNFIQVGQSKQSQKDQLRLEIYGEDLDRKENSFFNYGHEKGMELLEEPYYWFKKQLSILRPKYTTTPLAIAANDDEAYMRIAKQILTSLNLGIHNIKVEIISIDEFYGVGDEEEKNDIIKDLEEGLFAGITILKNGIEYSIYKNDEGEYLVAKLITFHEGKKEHVPFELTEESVGTQKIIEILPVIINTILYDRVYWYDEIETSVHPSIIKQLIEIYLHAGSTCKGQIIFTTHECNLLDLELLRQDEIWFTEKDEDGVSHVYSLSDFKPRFDKDIRKGYLEGQFTTIPFFTEPDKLNWNDVKKTTI